MELIILRLNGAVVTKFMRKSSTTFCSAVLSNNIPLKNINPVFAFVRLTNGFSAMRLLMCIVLFYDDTCN